MARIIAVSNQKGGVGKTTTAVNLASSLAMQNCKVLLVDMDPQGNAGSGVGVQTQKLTSSMYNVLVNDIPIQEIIVKTATPNLDIASSDQNLSGAELELVSVIGREVRLKEALEAVSELYDYIIIDTPPTLGLLTVNSLTAANSVLIPMQCEYYAMEGLSQLLKTTTLIKRRLNPYLEREGILLTMFDKRNNLSSQVENEIRTHFGEEVFKQVIPRNVTLSEAPSYGKPALMYAKNSVGSRSYVQLANEINQRYQNIKDKTAKTHA